MLFNRHQLLSFLIVFACLVTAVKSQADTVTVQFSGHIFHATGATAGTVGNPFAVTLGYDTSVTGTEVDDFFGAPIGLMYDLLSLKASIGSNVYEINNVRNLTVTSSAGVGGDQVLVYGDTGALPFSFDTSLTLQLHAPTGAALTSYAFPQNLDISAFDFTAFSLSDFNQWTTQTTFSATGRIDSISTTEAPSSVPEPSAFLLLAPAFVALGVKALRVDSNRSR